ncbi:hypothetical protein FSP39_017301 [Pinctada imbricata]|uniref:C2H2-type domain-containing protein n=1 Tax=Pinctada imbricata TaxID=66713 RepID=A0AA88YKT2_PINIB|nr:hypothetical protein FSP39_017301 [Pinctada imbricata]
MEWAENHNLSNFESVKEKSSSIPIAKYPSKECRFRTCNERFQSRRELYLHRNTEHQSGEGPSADIVIPEDQNEQFKVVYKANTKFVYEEDTDD